MTCEGRVVADHARCWANRQVLTDPANVTAAAELRKAFTARTAATRGLRPPAGLVVGARSLSDYDDLFGVTTPAPGSRPTLTVVR